MKILLVEDDVTIASGIEYSLQQEGFVVCKATSVKEALSNIEGVDLYLLDLTLPDGTGYEICRKVKEQGDKPVIFLSACDEEVNVVMGLDMGADDYITKPFRVRELISRIRTVLRRYEITSVGQGGSQKQSSLITISNVTVSINEAKVYKNGNEVELTALEYRLFLTFLMNRGQVLSRNQLLSDIWDVAGDSSYVNDNTLTVYIKRLRDKLEDNPSEPCIIETVRGMGYRVGKNV